MAHLQLHTFPLNVLCVTFELLSLADHKGIQRGRLSASISF